MSWTSVFPVLSDEMVREYASGASKEERAELDEWFAVDQVINPTPGTRHLVSFSLFWKNRENADPDLPKLTRRTLKQAKRRGLVQKYDPWEHYVQPLLDGATLILRSLNDVAFRVYLAADMKFLVKDLVQAGCEVYLMKSSSLRHNPGAMWRFLALEEKGRLVTIADTDRARRIEADLLRTAASEKAGLGMWRVPVWGDLGETGEVVYRPMFGGQFGGSGRLPMQRLMKAFVWHSRRGTIAPTCQVPACGERTIKGASWPDYGFDEFFLIAGVYPRMARKGILSFIPSNARSQLLLLDIEYATWANPRSEVVYFGSNGACCAPRPKTPALVPTIEKSAALKSPGEFAILSTEGLTQRHRLPPFARRPQPHRQDITGKVWAWFNPASILWKGKRWLAYRTECSPMWHWTRTSLVNLDEEFRPIAGTNKILDLPTGFGRWGAEDPRFTIWEDRLFLSYSDAYRTGLCEITAEGHVVNAGLFPNDLLVEGVTTEKDRREKNWGFFGAPGGMFMVYWVNPHVVFEGDPHRHTLGESYSTPWTPPVETSCLHGGSSPVWHDGLYWRVVHSSSASNGSGRTYRLWLMAFADAPPFAPKKFCVVPLVIGEPETATRPEPIPHHVVFCSSLERVENGWLLFFGESDLRIRQGIIADELIEPHLESVNWEKAPADSRSGGLVAPEARGKSAGAASHRITNPTKTSPGRGVENSRALPGQIHLAEIPNWTPRPGS